MAMTAVLGEMVTGMAEEAQLQYKVKMTPITVIIREEVVFRNITVKWTTIIIWKLMFQLAVV